MAPSRSTEDPGIAYILSEKKRELASRLLSKIDPFLGEWIGTREQGQQPGKSIRHYERLAGTYNVNVQIEATFTDGFVFRAAEHMNYSPVRNTLVGYWFEDDGTVQIFELDKRTSGERKLVWREILRKGRLFRVEEVISQQDELTVSAFQQDKQGAFQLFARSIYRRKKAGKVQS